MKKRCLSILLVLALCLTYLPVTAYADTVTALTVTGPEQKYRAGDLVYIGVNSSLINISGNGSGVFMFDGWHVDIDGVSHYQSDTDYNSLTWDSGSSYTLVIPIAPEGDSFDADNLTCTYNGVNATSWLTGGGAASTSLEVPLYVATEAAATAMS